MSLHKFGYMLCFFVFLNLVQVFATKVYLLFPKGFSINVDNRPGIVSVQFDVNITKNEGNATAIYYSKHVRNYYTNSWALALVKRNVAFDIGDTIFYKTVIAENNTNEQIESGLCKVTELPTMGALRKHGWTFNYDILLDCNLSDSPTPPPATNIVVRASEPSENFQLQLQQCQESIFNSSLTVLSLQMEVDELRKLTQQLANFEEKYPLAKQLTLAGRIPPDGDPVETVQFMVYEKLDLQPTIESAFRDSTYSIRFTVSTVIEKIEVLEAAKYALASTQITIT